VFQVGGEGVRGPEPALWHRSPPVRTKDVLAPIRERAHGPLQTKSRLVVPPPVTVAEPNTQGLLPPLNLGVRPVKMYEPAGTINE
jgi:hypothetical protein